MYGEKLTERTPSYKVDSCTAISFALRFYMLAQETRTGDDRQQDRQNFTFIPIYVHFIILLKIDNT